MESERLDAHVLTFPRGRAPEWVVFPVHQAESEAVAPVVVLEHRAVPAGDVPSASRWRAALGPAQQELGL